MNYFQLFRVMLPQVILAFTGLIALTLDLTFFRRSERRARNRRLGIVVIIGLLVTLICVWEQFIRGPIHLFGGTIVVNKLSAVFDIVIVVLTGLTTIISIEYDLGRHVGEYFATLLFGAIGMTILVSSEELITIFIALELTSICLYVLTAFHKGALRSQEAAVKYFMFGAISSAFLLFGLSYVFGVTGATNLTDIARNATAAGPSPLMATGLLFIIIGFGFKVAVVPFHLWAPDAYEGAPTPVTAFIATGSKVASFVVFAKVMMLSFPAMTGSALSGHFSSGWTMLLAITAALSMVLGNCVAIVQHNVKRLLAYSSIAHAGYIFVGLVAASITGATSVFFYIIVYSLTNLGAFGVVAALADRAGEEMRHFNGMARRAPFLSLLMLVFILSLAGIPPLAGFFGKFYLFAAAIQRDTASFGLLWLVALGIFTSAVSLYYYLVLLKHIYVLSPIDNSKITTPVYLNITLGVVALGVVLLGIFPERLAELLNSLVATLLQPPV